MKHSPIRMIGSQFTAAIVGVVATAIVLSGGFAFAEDAPESGNGVAEALAGPNTVNSAAIINGEVTSTDIATGTIGRGDIKPGVVPLWAKVDADVTFPDLIGSRGVNAVSRISLGQYDVTFNRSIVGCGWVVTRNDNTSGGAGNGEMAAEQASSNDPNRLRIRMYDSSGALADPQTDDGFTVMVLCG